MRDTRTTEIHDLSTAARRLGVHRRSVRRLVDAGSLQAERTGAGTGTRYSISETELLRFQRERSKS